MQTFETTAACTCGRLQLALRGRPIFATECYCCSCQTAHAQLEALPGAPPILNPQGGTPYTLMRKDRVALMTGVELLASHRLSPSASTRRVRATCCNAPMFLEFSRGHWLSIYTDRIPEHDRTPISLRCMTGDLPEHLALPPDVPNASSHTFGFMARLFGAWIAMGLRTPKPDWMEIEP